MQLNKTLKTDQNVRSKFSLSLSMAATHPSSSSFSNPNPNSLSLALHPSSISSSPRLLPSSPPCSTLITMNYSACYSASSSYSVMPCACFSPWKMSSSSSSTCKAVSRSSSIRSMAPDEEKMTRRSPLDFPIVSPSYPPLLLVLLLHSPSVSEVKLVGYGKTFILPLSYKGKETKPLRRKKLLKKMLKYLDMVMA